MYPLGNRHLQFSFWFFWHVFCISSDIHISIPMTVFFRNRLPELPMKEENEYCSKCEAWCSMKIFYCVHDIFRTSLVIWIQRWPLSSKSLSHSESSLTLLIFSSVLKLTCRWFCTLYWPSSLYFNPFAGQNFYLLGIL